MELLRYLNDSFFTERQLLAACGSAAPELETLQRRGMMPQPSYRLRLDVACDSFFGAHGEHAQVRYYAKGYASWIGRMQSVAGSDDAFGVFAERYRARLAQLNAAGVWSGHAKLNADLDAHLREEWRYFLDGTYGLCTSSGLPEDIAAKELAVAIIKEITEHRSERALTDAERSALTIAVDLLDAASAQFAPHEAARSSRFRLIDEVRKTYRL